MPVYLNGARRRDERERLAPFTPPNVREWRIDTTPTPPPASTKKITQLFFFSGEPIRLQRPDNQSPNCFLLLSNLQKAVTLLIASKKDKFKDPQTLWFRYYFRDGNENSNFLKEKRLSFPSFFSFNQIKRRKCCVWREPIKKKSSSLSSSRGGSHPYTRSRPMKSFRE